MVIDLRYLNQIKVSEDRETVLVGPGCRWGEVYEKVEAVGLTLIGGRASSVGVGGFTLGGKRNSHVLHDCVLTFEGGISFLSRRHGWALDNVHSFQVRLMRLRTVSKANTVEGRVAEQHCG